MGSEATFGAMLRRYRRQARLSQEELAARAYVSTRAISDLERGVNARPRRHTAIALADGLGLDGDERLAFELHARPDEEPAPAAVVPRARPPLTLDGFIDDGSSLARLVAVASDPHHRLITLIGPGGVGKTRLALEMAQRLDRPVAFVDLTSLSESSLLAATIRDALGAEHGPARTHLQSLVEHLAPQTLTLVLDNMEQVVAAAGDVAVLLQSCPGLRVVVTSRLPLRIAGELRFDVRPLATAVDGATDPPSVQLFLERAIASGFDAPADPASRAAVAELCARLDGLPLAIELAAARARIVAPAEMLRHLDQILDLLSTGRSDAPAQHRSMSAALEWSFRLLPPPAQDAFAALGVFASGASAEAAMTVWGLPATATPAFFDLVQVLAEAHLISVEPAGAAAAMRIHMFETARQFARQRLGESGAAPLAQQRLTMWALDLVERAEPELSRPDVLHWLDLLDRELPNLRAAGRHLAEHDDDEAVDTGLRLVAGLQRYWDIRSRWTEGVSWLRDALARPGGAATSRGKAYKALGVMHRCTGELEAAETEMQRAVEMYTAAGDQRGLALCLNNLGVVAIDRAQHDTACAWFRRALALCEANDDELPTGTLLNNLGLATTESGARREAFRLCRESRRRLLAQGDLHAACWAEDNMATVLTRAGHPSWAIPLHQVTVRRRIAFGDENGFMWSLEALAEAWTESGDTDRAGRTLGFVAAHRRRLGTIAAPFLLDLTRRRSDAVIRRVGRRRFTHLWDEGVALDPAVVRGWFAG